MLTLQRFAPVLAPMLRRHACVPLLGYPRNLLVPRSAPLRRTVAAAAGQSPLHVTRHPDADVAAFLQTQGFAVSTVTLPRGHILTGYAHTRPRKRLAVAAGVFVIAAGDVTPTTATTTPAAVLHARDWVDIPVGWRHSAWVQGEEAVVLVVGDG